MTRRARPWRRCVAPLSLAALASLAIAASARADTVLDLPGNANMTREQVEEAGDYALPIGPWSDGAMPTLDVQGQITRQAWRIDSASPTTLQLMDQLAAQLEGAGFSPVFRCAAVACGGFDFRFGQAVLPPPEMFVDLFDYRFLAAHKPAGAQGGAEGDDTYVTLLISRSGADSYIQVTRITPAGADTDQPVASAVPGTGNGVSLVEALTRQGHTVLGDLDFATGADTLGPGPFASLRAVAAFLKAGDTRRIALVGHTDTVGGMEANLALSRRRARAVMQRLIEAHDVPPAQLEAEGIAYLSPRAPNGREEGREANRRVEAVLLSAD